jgi:serine/threonine protein kinase
MDRTIAVRHAEVVAGPTSAYVQPLPNTGSVRVNGAPIQAATEVFVGDSVQIGETILRLYTDEERSEPVLEPISLRDIVAGARTKRTGSIQSPFVDPHADLLRCTGCGVPGIKPPRPDLWDAAWLCTDCSSKRRRSLVGMPTRIGSFNVLQPIAQGGMGEVYEGVEVNYGLHVAIKILRPARGVSEAIIQRFMREQQIIMALRHPNIVGCYDVGTWENGLYIVFEYISGGNALSISSLKSPLQQVLWLGADLFRALGYGHDLNIVHRDVKPANLLLGRMGPQAALHGKLADYGLAKSMAGLGKRITKANESGGSLLTIGPEQLEDFVNVGPHGDLYSAAATVFWMLTGQSPLFLPCAQSAATIEQKAQAIVDPSRKRLLDLRPDVPQQVAILIDGLVAHNPSFRMQVHAREVAAALNAVAVRMKQPRSEVRNEQVQSNQIKEAVETVELCIGLLERGVERAAREVREAFQSQDQERIDRASVEHDAAQSDLEKALMHWERIVSAS